MSGRSLRGRLAGHLFSFSSPWADHAGLSQFPAICKDLSASTGLMGRAAGGGRGARGHLSLSGDVLHAAGLALLPAAPAARAANLEKMQNMHLENIYSSSQLGDHGSGPSSRGLTCSAFSPGPTELGTRGLLRDLIPVPANPQSTTISRDLGLKFSEMPSKPLLSPLTPISRLLFTIRLQPRWPIIIKL